MSSDFQFNEWTEKRKRTSRVFYIQNLLNGIEYSLTYMNLYLYLKQVIKTDHLVFHYTAISTGFLLSLIVNSLILGRIFDHYRNFRVILIFANVTMIIGNVFYIIPISPWFLFTGRVVSGVGSCMRSLITAELARSYKEKEVLVQFSRLGMAFGIGFIAGPGINFAFVNANFQFLGIHIMFANGAGLLLIFFLFIQLGLVVFFVSNLSKEFDLKEALSGTNQGEEEEEEEELFIKYKKLLAKNLRETSSSTASFTNEENQDDEQEEPEESAFLLQNSKENLKKDSQSFFKIIMSIDMVLIMIMSMFFMHSYYTYDLWQPMAAVQYLDWGIFEINFVTFGWGIGSILVYVIYMFTSPSKRSSGYINIVCIFCNVIVISIFITWKTYNQNTKINIFLSVLYGITFPVVALIEYVFLPSVLASLVPSHCQAFAEGARLSFSRVGSMLAVLFAASMFKYLEYVCVTYITVTFILLVLFLWRMKRLVG